MALTNKKIQKRYKDGAPYFERYVDSLKDAIEDVSRTTNLNLTQLKKDLFYNAYNYTNDGAAQLGQSLQDQINSLAAGGIPLTGTTSNTFVIRSASNSLTLSAASLTTPITVTFPDEGGEVVLIDATQTLSNKELTDPTFTNPLTGVELTEPTIDTPAFVNFPNWTSPVLIGSGLSVPCAQPALAALNSTDVAFIDASNDELRCYRFDGSTWSLVGSGLSILGSGFPALAALSSTDVAFIDSALDSLRCYTFNGSTWSLVGSGLSISTVGTPALAALNSTDVAFIDDSNDSLRCYRFDGSTWSLVGSGLSISSITVPALAALNGTDVAFTDATNDKLKCYRFDGSTWSQIGGSLTLSSVSFAAMAALNGTDIAFIDATPDTLECYRFNFSLHYPYSAAGGAF